VTRDRRPDGLTLNPWYRGRNLVWDAKVVDTFAESHYIVSATIPGNVATDAGTDKCRKYNDLPDNYYFQPAAIETPRVCGKATAPFLSSLAKKLVDMSGHPGSDSGFTSACPWLWSEETLPAYWLVCKFDLILAIFNALTSVPARHLPLFNEWPLSPECLRFL